MKKVEVRIKRKDKKRRRLTLANLREDWVNSLYRETVSGSTRNDQIFYVLIFFLATKRKGRTLLEQILEAALPKLRKLNKRFADKQNRLVRGEYRRFIEEEGLSELVDHDILFVLIEALEKAHSIKTEFTSFFLQNPGLLKDFNDVEKRFSRQVDDAIKKFKSTDIQDIREGYFGSTLDLSKSIYHMVKMRNSRNLDLNLQKYTDLTQLVSKSPVDLLFIQSIDAKIIFDLWGKFHIEEYISRIFPDIASTVKNHASIDVNFGELIPMWLFWRYTASADKKAKSKAKNAFDNQVHSDANTPKIESLVETLVNSVINSREHLEGEILKLKTELMERKATRLTEHDREVIEKIEERIEDLEDIEVFAEKLKKSE